MLGKYKFKLGNFNLIMIYNVFVLDCFVFVIVDYNFI